MPHGYLKHAAKGDVSRRAMRGGGSGKSLGSGGSARRRMKEIKLGADGTKKGSRGHGGKGAQKRDMMSEVLERNHDHGIDFGRQSNDGRAPIDPAPRSSSAWTPGARVRFEAQPGVHVEATVARQVGEAFTIEVAGGISIPGVRREQLSLVEVSVGEDSSADSFVLVGAPLPRAESVGALLPRLDENDGFDGDDQDADNASVCSLESIDDLASLAEDEGAPSSRPPLAMTWAARTDSKGTPLPPPSFQALQAEDEAEQSFETRQAPERPNPRVVRELHAMGFEVRLCAEAALCTGNESVEKAARWLVESIEEHERVRRATQQRSATSEPSGQVGFVDKLAAAYPTSEAASSNAAAAADDAAAAAAAAAGDDDDDDDDWEQLTLP